MYNSKCFTVKVHTFVGIKNQIFRHYVQFLSFTYRRYSELVFKYSVGLYFFCDSPCDPKFYGALVCQFISLISLTLCCFVVYSTRRFVVCLSVCHFVLVFFSPFSIAITSLGEEKANLSAFRTFVWFVLV